ncbi:MAG: hypothetical protein ACYTBZ_28530 [Planctomycetota bacterium]
MSDGLKNIAAPDVSVTIGDKSYRLTAMTPESLGEVEDHVITLRANPVAKTKEVLDLFSPEEQLALMTEAVKATTQMNIKASQEEVDNFLNSYAGVCFMLWTMIRTHQPEIKTPAEVRELLRGLTEVDIIVLQEDMKRVSGMGAMGNSPSQTQDQEAVVESLFRGENSIAT